jgi:hypothetical protein
MLCLGVIKREASPNASPTTVVKKKDGLVRICLDVRMINSKIIADCESPPATDELLRRFHGVRFMSTIDLRSSYWQIPLSPENRQYTSFLYNGRSYTYQVLPFGFKTAVGSFSRAMDVVLGTEVREFVVNYIDDLLVASKNLDEHLEHLRRVFEILRQAKMTINLQLAQELSKTYTSKKAQSTISLQPASDTPSVSLKRRQCHTQKCWNKTNKSCDTCRKPLCGSCNAIKCTMY